MKKILAVAIAALFMSTSFVFGLSVGARGNFNLGLGTSNEDESISDAINGNIGGGLGAYVNIGLLKIGSFGFGIQPEVNFNFNNGWKTVASGSVGNIVSNATSVSTYTNTLDIPVLLTFDLPVSKSFSLGLGAGPLLSVPMKADTTTTSTTSTGLFGGNSTTGVGNLSDVYDVTAKLNWGLAFDVNAKFSLGKLIRLVADVRYNLDMKPTEFVTKASSSSVTSEEFTRRTLNLGLGLEVGF